MHSFELLKYGHTIRLCFGYIAVILSRDMGFSVQVYQSKGLIFPRIGSL